MPILGSQSRPNKILQHNAQKVGDTSYGAVEPLKCPGKRAMRTVGSPDSYIYGVHDNVAGARSRAGVTVKPDPSL